MAQFKHVNSSLRWQAGDRRTREKARRVNEKARGKTPRLFFYRKTAPRSYAVTCPPSLIISRRSL